MDAIVDLLARRRTDSSTPRLHEGEGDRSAVVLTFPARQPAPPADDSMTRLDRAVERLQEVVSRALLVRGQVAPSIETEMLAILGELAMDCVDDAAARAERLARGLARSGR
jgi:hypothetical protein